MADTTRRQFKARLAGKQDVTRAISALMGDGNGTVEIPGQPGYVYIRVCDGDLGQAFNNRCPLADNLAIYVGYDPITDPDRRIFQVLSVRMADYAGGGSTPYANVAAHHASHEYGGGDDVYLSWRRLMGLRVGRPALFVVTVDGGYIYYSGSWQEITATNVDLTAEHTALVGVQAQYTLISLSSVGVVTHTNGTPVGSPAALTIADCPAPPAGHIPLAAVRLYKTQTAIGDIPTAPDIIDLRYPTFNTMSAYVTPHNVLSLSHGDSLADSVLDGDVIIGNVTPRWSRLGISIPAANVRNVLGVDNGELRPSWKTALDATAAADVANAAAAGTSLVFSHRDHAHRGIVSVNKSGSATLYGAVTLSEGANITLTQAGQDISIAAAAAGAHNIFSATHSDTTGAASPIDGDLIIANVTPAWSKLAISIPAANVRNALGIDNGELRPSWKTTLDATNPTTIGIGDAGGPGTSLVYSHRDHQHPSPATWTATAHAMLSTTHNDSTAAAVTNGMVMIGSNALSPTWTGLAHPGDTGKVLRAHVNVGSGRNEILWSDYYLAGTGTLTLGITAGKVLTLTAANDYNLTVAATGTAVVGTGTLYRLIAWAGTNTVTTLDAGVTGAVLAGNGLGYPGWSVYSLIGTVGGTTNLAVTNTKTLTLTATDSYNLTIPKTGTAVVGTGTAGQVAAWVTDANTLQAAALIAPASNILTITNAAASTLALAITSAKTLTLTATDNFNLTVPATGTVALLGTANAFTDSNTIASGKFLTALTDGSTGGLRAGSGSDVLWYRSGADMWRTPDGLTVDLGLNVGTASSAATGQVRASAAAMLNGMTAHQYAQNLVSNLADHGKTQIGLAADDWAFVFILCSNGQNAIYALNGGGHTVNEISDPSGTFTTTEDNDTTINIYWDAGNARYEINNEYGSSQSFYLWLLRYGS